MGLSTQVDYRFSEGKSLPRTGPAPNDLHKVIHIIDLQEILSDVSTFVRKVEYNTHREVYFLAQRLAYTF